MTTTGFKYNDVDLNVICEGTTSTTFTTGFTQLSRLQSGLSITFTNNTVNERPNNLNYKYNGVDISTYCIAKYSITTGSIAIPTKCTSIGVILVGGGAGSGGSTQNQCQAAIAYVAPVYVTVSQYDRTTHHNQGTQHGNIQQNQDGANGAQTFNLGADTQGYPNNNQNVHVWPTRTYEQQQQTGTAAVAEVNSGSQAGQAGVGGSYVYLTSTVTQGSNINIVIGAGGTASAAGTTSFTAGGDTYIQIAGGSAIYAPGGGSNTTISSGGNVITNTRSTTTASGVNANAATLNNYGTGADGSPARSQGSSQAGVAGQAGTTGYARVYYFY